MSAPGRPRRKSGQSGGRLLALLAALIVLALGYAWFGATAIRMPFAAMLAYAVAATMVYAILMWRVMAIKDDGIALSGALVAGAGAPLVGAFLLDVMVIATGGSGDAVARSLLLAYWPLGVAAALAGAAAGLAAAALARRRSTRAVRGLRLD